MQLGRLNPIFWIGSSHQDLKELSEDVRDVIGFGLFEAPQGKKSASSKPLKGFGSAAVLEIVAKDPAGTYRGIYTVKFAGIVYVLHVFQKKSAKGIATPKHELDLIRSRLADARIHYESYKHENQNS